jgi:hypothetical protein
MTIVPLPAFADNYIWMLQDGRNAIVVDPGDAKPVFDALERGNLQLAAILVRTVRGSRRQRRHYITPWSDAGRDNHPFSRRPETPSLKQCTSARHFRLPADAGGVFTRCQWEPDL